MFKDGEVYTIQYQKIISDKKLLPSTRLLATEILDKGYMRVGDYLKELVDNDLNYFLRVAEDTECEEFAEVALLSEMLATSEGLDPSSSLDDFIKRTTAMIGFFACEGLFRKGIVKLHRENMSFGSDMGDKLLVEKIRD